jgi:hypothetical protein
MRGNRNMGRGPGGGGGGETKSPHERYDIIFFQHFSRAHLIAIYYVGIPDTRIDMRKKNQSILRDILTAPAKTSEICKKRGVQRYFSPIKYRI